LPDPVPESAVVELLEAARLAPSGSNRQPWRFIVVTDPAEKKKLRALSVNQRFIEEAPVLFVCFADITTLGKEAGQMRWAEFEQAGVLETLSGLFADPAFRRAMEALPEPSRAQAIAYSTANAYIAIEHLVLMATAMGLGSCWVGALGGPGELNEIFGLADHLVPVALIPVGYTDKWPSQRPRLRLEELLLRPLPVASPATAG